MRTYDYIVKEEDRVVVCIMTIISDGEKFRFSGVAKCSDTDDFSAEKGKKIAQIRALLKFKKAVLTANKMSLKSMHKVHQGISNKIMQREKAIGRICDTISRMNEEIAELTK